MKTVSLMLAAALIVVVQFALSIPLQPWPYLAAFFLITLQPRFGWRLRESALEFLGFAAANVIAIAIVVALHDSNLSYLIVTLSVVLLTLFAMRLQNRFHESFLIAASTLVILLMQSSPSLAETTLRAMQINLGIIIAMVVTRYLVTRESSMVLISEYRYTLENCRQLFSMIVEQPRSPVFDAKFSVVENNIRSSLQEQHALIAESSHSMDSAITKEKLVMNVGKQQSLVRDIVLVAQFITHTQHQFFNLNYGDYLEKFSNAILTAFDQLIAMLDKNAKVATYFDLYEVFASVEENLRLYRDENFSDSDSGQAFIFALQQLVRDIDEWCGSCLEFVNRHGE